MALSLADARAQEPKRAAEKARGGGDAVAQAVARLAEGLKAHPARPLAGRSVLSLYMTDLVAGGTTLLADQPDPGLNACGTPKWSGDGTRIVFDARPWNQMELSRLKLLTLADGRPTITDLGPGNGPTFSPDNGRVAFLLSPGAEGDQEAGVWIMDLDGKGRQRVTDPGVPFWSADGREFLINDFSTPTNAAVIDIEKTQGGFVEVADKRLYSWPSWAGPQTLIASLGEPGQRYGDSIVLLDVTRPEAARVSEVVWEWDRGGEDIGPLWPVAQPGTRQCYFVGFQKGRRTLYRVERGTKKAEPLGGKDFYGGLAGLAFSPDGRYLLFVADQAEGPEAQPAPAQP